MEKLNNSIKAENVESHIGELEKKLEEIQLFFVDQKIKQQINENINFSDILVSSTNLCGWIIDEYKRKKRKNGQKMEDVIIEGELDELKNEIDKMYNKNKTTWQAEIIEAIKKEEKKLGISKKCENNEKIAGLFHFNIKKEITDLQNLGIGPLDECMEIHLEELFKQGEKAVSKEEIKKSLTDLAEKIVKEYPAVVAVIGVSWLMAHPLARRLGFKIFPKNNLPQNQASVWVQLVDESGQIDKKRLKNYWKQGNFYTKTLLGLSK